MKNFFRLSIAIALFAGLTFSCSSGKATVQATEPTSYHTYVLRPLSYQVVPCEYAVLRHEARLFPIPANSGKAQSRSLMNYWPGYMRIV